VEVRSHTEFLRFFLQKKKYQAKDEIPTEKPMLNSQLILENDFLKVSVSIDP
jgi:hypothetical protein